MNVGITCLALLATLPVTVRAQATAPPMRQARLVMTLGVDSADDVVRGAFGSAGPVRSAPDGRIYVLDGRQCQIKMFDQRGVYRGAFGRSGAGPGEFSCRGMLVTTEQDGIVVTDLTQSRVVRYSFSGAHLSTTAMPGGEAGLVRGTALRNGFTVRDEGISLRRADTQSPTFDPYTYVVLRRASQRRVDTLASIRRDHLLVRLPDGRLRPATAGFGNGGAWAVWRDSVVAIVDGYAGAVRWFVISASGARITRTTSLGVVGRAVTSADLRAMERRVPEDPLLRAMRVVPASVAEPPAFWSAATDAKFADDGALWVGAPSEAGRPRVWTVFPLGGQDYRVSIPGDVTLSSARGEIVYCVGTNEDDIPVVRVYRIDDMPERGPGAPP